MGLDLKPELKRLKGDHMNCLASDATLNNTTLPIWFVAISPNAPHNTTHTTQMAYSAPDLFFLNKEAGSYPLLREGF